MADSRKIISFDTSSMNHLADDPDSDALLVGLAVGYSKG